MSRPARLSNAGLQEGVRVSVLSPVSKWHLSQRQSGAAILALAIFAGATSSAAADQAAPRIGRFVTTAIFGDDERRALPKSHEALRAKIGFLSLGEASICSAFCVSEDTIATASHCLLGTAQSPPPDLKRISFSVGGPNPQTSRLDGQSRTQMRARLSAGTAALRITPPIEAARDWAVARLEKPVCRSGGLKLTGLDRTGIERRAARGEIYQVAMHRDFEPGTLVLGGPCTLARDFAKASATAIASDFLKPEAILMHTCDTGPGSSGSPLLSDGDEGPEVVGMNVGTYVLSRTPANTTSTNSPESRQSEAIANTAIHAGEFRAAIEQFSLETSSIQDRRRP